MGSLSRWCVVASLIATMLAARAAPAPSQVLGDTVAEARRLHDTGGLAAAKALLEMYLYRHPDNGDAARLLAQTLYWMKQPAAARKTYEDALVRHPADSALRLDYGRLLIETGAGARAREILTPLRGAPAIRGRAEALLGTFAYWDGDLSAAKKLLTEALRADSAQPDVRRELDEISVLTSPWVGTGMDLRHDNQPLDRVTAEAMSGWYPAPLTSLTVHIRATHLNVGDSVAQSLTIIDGGLTHYAPVLRLNTEITAGVLQRSSGESDWVGRLDVRLRVSQRVTVDAAGERAPYLYTAASVTTAVMTSALRATVDWNLPSGWLGEVRAQSERYPDDNLVRTGYLWLLAPLLHHRTVDFQIGYSVAVQDADQSRFVLNNPSQQVPPGNPGFDTDGHYAPYYTPAALVTQSLLATTSFQPSPHVEVHVNGAYGFAGREDAPGFSVVTGGSQPTVELTFARRSFTPWNLRGAAGLDVAPGLRLTATGEAGATAFYHYMTASAYLSYHFAAAARRRLAQR